MKSLLINLPKFLNQIKIEKLLQTYFSDSIKRNKIVIFDMADIVWASPYCLSLLLLWANKVSFVNKVQFKSPGLDSHGDVPEKSKGIIGFLGNWGYWEALTRSGVELIASNNELLYRERLNDFSAKCVPFQFFNDHDSLYSYLEQLDLPSKITEAIEKSANVNLIGIKGLRSIIIQELANNAFDHGGGKAAHLSIGITPKVVAETEHELTEKLYKRLHAVPRFMVNFYKALKNEQCLEIVISDLGDGIFETLKHSYQTDDIVKNKSANLDEHTVLRYAYLLHSTSKKDRWSFKVDTGRDESDYKPPRGLYFVKNIARRNKAFLMCRSGQSLISFDFLSSSIGKFATNLIDKRLKKIANLGGTQIYMMVPLLEQKKRVYVPASLSSFELEGLRLPTVHIFLKKFFKASEQGEIVRNIVKKVHKIAIAKGKKNLFVVDFLGTKWKKETIFPVISEILYLGLDSYKFIAINVDEDFDDYLELSPRDSHDDSFQLRKQPWQKQRPFVIHNKKNNDFRLSKFHNLQEINANEIFNDIISGKSVDINSIPEFLDHIIVVRDNKPFLTFSINALIDSINSIQIKTLEKIILDPKESIKHEGKYLFPTLTYSQTFYEVGAFFESDWKTALLRDVLSKAITAEDVENKIILSTSKIGKKLGELLESHFNDLPNSIHHINTSRPEIKTSKLLKLPPDKKIILLVDVIATGKSLLSLVDRLSLFGIFNRITKIVCIVDIRDEFVATNELITPNGKIPIEALIKVPTRLYSESRPADWSWSEIERIDSESWKIIQSESFPSHLWVTSEERFISSVIDQADGIEEGHFFNKENDKHYSYFFLTKKICNKFGPEISTAIIKHSKELSKKRGVLTKISHIIVSGRTFGLDRIIETILAETGAKLLKISDLNSVSANDLSEVKLEGVIIIDSAISAGDTIWSLLDIATMCSANAIYVYIIMNRASNRTALRFRKLQRYNNADVSIEQVVSLPILAYKSKKCPICERMIALDALKAIDCLAYLSDIIDEEIAILKPLPIENFVNNPTWEYVYDREALKKRVNLRIKIQKFIDGDRQAWQDILAILDSDTINSFYATALVRVLFNEVQLFSNLHQEFPPDFRKKLFVYCKSLIKTNERWRVALGVAAAFKFDMLIKNIKEISDTLIQIPNGFKTLIVEIMLHKEKIMSEELHDCFILLKERHSERLNYELTLSLDGAANYFNKEIAKSLNKPDKPIYHFKEIAAALFLKRGHELHDRLREVWPFISGITPEKSSEIIEHHYFGDRGFDYLVRKCILPNMSAISSSFDSIITSQFPYLKKQIFDDVELLNSKIFKLVALQQNDDLSDAAFKRAWEDESFKKAKKRILDCIISPDGIFRKFILSQFCDGDSIVKNLAEYWKNEFKENKIQLVIECVGTSSEVFFFEDSFASVLNNFFSNVLKHAFPHGVNDEAKLTVRTESVNLKYLVTIFDNGVGILEERQKELEDRLESIFKPYGTKMKIATSPGHTKTELLFFKKGNLL